MNFVIDPKFPERSGNLDFRYVTELSYRPENSPPAVKLTTNQRTEKAEPCLATYEEASTWLDGSITCCIGERYDDPYVLAQRFGMSPDQARSVLPRCESCMGKLGEAFRHVQACFPEGLGTNKSGSIH